MFAKYLVLPLVISTAVTAAPIATVSTGGFLQINGKGIPTTGAPSWPLAVNDDIVTAGDAAVISFPDGARLTMGKDTHVVLKRCGRCVAQLHAGSLDYKMAAKSTTEICALGHPIHPVALTEGSVRIENSARVVLQVKGKDEVQVAKGACACAVPAAWIAKKPLILIISTAAAGGTAAALGFTRGPSAVSPSR